MQADAMSERRQNNPHGGEGARPIGELIAELGLLLDVYREYPGIAADLRRALADLEARRPMEMVS